MRKIKILKNRYVDSVSLMSISSKIMSLPGIENAEVHMGTPANVEILTGLGYDISEDVGPNDLVMAVKGDTGEHVDEALDRVEDMLEHRLTGEDEISYDSITDIDIENDAYDIVQISLPGEYAAAEARKALEKGLDVFIFSDNVPLDQELELKKLGKEKGLLVMGPDCGVGFLNGVCLAAGSIYKSGPVGIVAASGSGAQEVGCIVERCGFGISSIIGTGGRDLYPEIGAITMLQGMDRLENDPRTKVIVLVSKLADLETVKKVLKAADNLNKPVVSVFLGSDEALYTGHKVIPAFSLEEAALKACMLLSDNIPDIHFTDQEIQKIVKQETAQYSKGQKYLRGLYCGGTFTEEALIYFNRNAPGITLYSNLKTKYAEKLTNHEESVGNTILDMGAEEFTRIAPHPVFEPSLRIKRLVKELEDPEVAAVVLDFITGPGVAEDPITPFIEVIKAQQREQTRHITYIANICGSMGDPQNVAEKTELLRQAGVITTNSNNESARLACELMNALEGGI